MLHGAGVKIAFGAIVLCVAAAIFPRPIIAQELTLDQIESLVRENSAFVQYRPEITSIVDQFHALKADGLPSRLLDDVLREGAAKRVPPSRLLAALQAAASRIRTAAGILKDSQMWPESLTPQVVSLREELVRRLCIVLQGGVSPLIVSTLMSSVTGGGASPSAERALRLCESLVAILQVAAVPGPDLLSMATTLLSSRLPDASFQSLPALFVRGRIYGLDATTLAQTVTAIASRGGGIILMDNEIRRIGGRR
ncbi:MAG TPA: hypothetical protein VMW87_06610 [Spirochaetia bacterium]|nr:hypothetical protein [Spirochaetia bacterium]